MARFDTAVLLPTASAFVLLSFLVGTSANVLFAVDLVGAIGSVSVFVAIVVVFAIGFTRLDDADEESVLAQVGDYARRLAERTSLVESPNSSWRARSVTPAPCGPASTAGTASHERPTGSAPSVGSTWSSATSPRANSTTTPTPTRPPEPTAG